MTTEHAPSAEEDHDRKNELSHATHCSQFSLYEYRTKPQRNVLFISQKVLLHSSLIGKVFYSYTNDDATTSTDRERREKT